MAQTTRLEIRNQRTEQVIQNVNAKIERWTLDQLTELSATHRTRQAAEHAFKKIALGRKYLLIPKHSAEERFFLRLLIIYALACRPNLVGKAVEVADYYSTNYAFEWTESPVSRLALQRARDMILSSAESEFGETPMASPLAYVYHHSSTLGIRNIANYGECYSRSAALTAHRHFHNTEQPWREKLGLHTIGRK